MKSKGVTIQMKALDECFLMVVFTLLLNRLHVFANFVSFGKQKHGSENIPVFFLRSAHVELT